MRGGLSVLKLAFVAQCGRLRLGIGRSTCSGRRGMGLSVVFTSVLVYVPPWEEYISKNWRHGKAGDCHMGEKLGVSRKSERE